MGCCGECIDLWRIAVGFTGLRAENCELRLADGEQNE